MLFQDLIVLSYDAKVVEANNKIEMESYIHFVQSWKIVHWTIMLFLHRMNGCFPFFLFIFHSEIASCYHKYVPQYLVSIS